MHAASVNPEPGSNSLKNVYLNPFRNLNPFSELLFNLASFYFLSFSQCVLTRTTLFSVFSHFLVVQFSMIKSLDIQAYLLYNIKEKKSRVFFDFFYFFYVFQFLFIFNSFDSLFLCTFTINL